MHDKRKAEVKDVKMVLGLGSLIMLPLLASPVSAPPNWDKNPGGLMYKGFVHAIALEIEGETCYFAGPGSFFPRFLIFHKRARINGRRKEWC